MIEPWPERQEITSPDAIKMLTNLRALRYLLPFMRQEHTLSTAAIALGRPPSTVAYWIPRFVRVGLVSHLGDEKRSGMAMPRYRAPAKQLTGPFAKIPFDSRVTFLDEGRMRVLRRFLDGVDEAIESTNAVSLGFSSPAGGGTAIEMIEAEDQRAQRHYTDNWAVVDLCEDDAVELSHALEALINRYADVSITAGPTARAGQRGRTRRYIVHGGLSPT